MMAQIIALNTRRPVAIPEPEHRRDHYREAPEGAGAAWIITFAAFGMIAWGALFVWCAKLALERLN